MEPEISQEPALKAAAYEAQTTANFPLDARLLDGNLARRSYRGPHRSEWLHWHERSDEVGEGA